MKVVSIAHVKTGSTIRSEPITGADWEWHFTGAGRSFGVRIQTKKANPNPRRPDHRTRDAAPPADGPCVRLAVIGSQAPADKPVPRTKVRISRSDDDVSDKFEAKLAPNDCRCTLKRGDGDVSVLGIEQTTNLAAARLHSPSQAVARYLVRLHRFGDLPRKHFLDGNGFMERKFSVDHASRFTPSAKPGCIPMAALPRWMLQ